MKQKDGGDKTITSWKEPQVSSIASLQLRSSSRLKPYEILRAIEVRVHHMHSKEPIDRHA